MKNKKTKNLHPAYDGCYKTMSVGIPTAMKVLPSSVVIEDYGTLSFDIQEANLPDELITPRAGQGLKKPSTEI